MRNVVWAVASPQVSAKYTAADAESSGRYRAADAAQRTPLIVPLVQFLPAFNRAGPPPLSVSTPPVPRTPVGELNAAISASRRDAGASWAETPAMAGNSVQR